MSWYGILAYAHRLDVYNRTAIVHIVLVPVTLVYVTLLHLALVHVTLVHVTFAEDQQAHTAAFVWAHSKPSMHPPQAQTTQGREKLQAVSTVARAQHRLLPNSGAPDSGTLDSLACNSGTHVALEWQLSLPVWPYGYYVVL